MNSPTRPTPTPSPSRRDGEGKSASRKIDALEKLLTVFSEEQLAVFAEQLALTQETARVRGRDQRVMILINNKGYPRFIEQRLSLELPAPSTYKAE